MAIKVAERELEDWVCDNPEQLLPCVDVRVVGRQMTLPSGRRLDVLLASNDPPFNDFILTVVELKSGPVDESTVAQLLGYMGEVWSLRSYWQSEVSRGRVYVHGLVAGPGITDYARYVVEGCTYVGYRELVVGVRVGEHFDEGIQPVGTMPMANWCNAVGEAAAEIEAARRARSNNTPAKGRGPVHVSALLPSSTQN